MKKILIIICLLCANLNVINAKESEEKPILSSYHEIDYEVKDSQNTKAEQRRNSLPTSYDARKENLVTSIKDQNPYGTCWAFALMSVAETSIIKKGEANKDNIDLSELQLVHAFYHRTNDPLNNTKNDIVYDYLDDKHNCLESGGNQYLTTMLLSQRISPVDETEDPYENAINEELKNDLNYAKTKFVMKEGVFLPDGNINAIKRAVINYGSVSIGYDSSAGASEYYFKKSNTIDHSVTIVGYDDSIDKSLFGPEIPTQNGAWIIKNSWGESAHEDGYFYLSYDQYMSTVLAYDFIENPSQNAYFYDGGVSLGKLTKPDEIKGANIYEVKAGSDKENEYLESVSMGLGRPDSNYEIMIYTDLKDINDPTSGTQALTTPLTGYKQYEGIYTVDLPNEIKLKQGSHFSVVVKTKNAYGSDTALMYASNADYGWLKTMEEVSPNQSFLYMGKDGWRDTFEDNYCFRIKAFTSTKEKSKNIADTKISLDDDSYTYQQEGVKPNVKVEIEGTLLVQDKDYTLSYVNNDKVGNATVKIIGINAYEGYQDVSFPIVAKEVEDTSITIDDIDSVVFNGDLHEPDVVIKDKDIDLVKDEDYTIAYKNNRYVGNAEIIINGKGNYTGQIKRLFTILRKETNTLEVMNIEDVVYNGEAITPIIVVKDGKKVLIEDTDFKVSYRNNTNIGIAEVIIKGMNNYSGEIKKTFNITPKEIEHLVINDIDSVMYSGKANTPSVIVKDNSKELIQDIDYRISYNKNINAGIAEVIIKGINNYSGKIKKTFNITPKEMEHLVINDIDSVMYSGKAHTPNVIVKDNSKELLKNIDYKISYITNINVGTAEITISGKGNYTGEVTKSFTIKPQALTSLNIDKIEDMIFNGSEIMPKVVIKQGQYMLLEGIDYMLSYQDNDKVGIASITINGKGNYTGRIIKSFMIKEKEVDKLPIGNDKVEVDTRDSSSRTVWGCLLIMGAILSFQTYKRVKMNVNKMN